MLLINLALKAFRRFIAVINIHHQCSGFAPGLCWVQRMLRMNTLSSVMGRITTAPMRTHKAITLSHVSICVVTLPVAPSSVATKFQATPCDIP